jgi:hypothetical protein
VKFADTHPNTICATKQITIPAMTLSIVNARFNGEIQKDKTYIANIHCLSNPTISGMPAVVSMDNNNNFKVIVKNCATYIVSIKRNDIMGLIKSRRRN